MAVMSFAHLKPSKNIVAGIAPTLATASDVKERKADSVAPPPGVMSFAHLRPSGNKQVKQVVAVKVEANEEATNHSTKVTPSNPHHTAYRIPAILPTARLSSVNYCRGCGRFMPASPWEKTVGVPYGRCRRDDEVIDGDVWEVWKIIPAGAIVARCWYWVKENELAK